MIMIRINNPKYANVINKTNYVSAFQSPSYVLLQLTTQQAQEIIKDLEKGIKSEERKKRGPVTGNQTHA